MTDDRVDPSAIIARLERQLARERRAREEAEAIAERSTRDLYLQVQALEQTRRDLLAAKDAAERASRGQEGGEARQQGHREEERKEVCS